MSSQKEEKKKKTSKTHKTGLANRYASALLLL